MMPLRRCHQRIERKLRAVALGATCDALVFLARTEILTACIIADL